MDGITLLVHERGDEKVPFWQVADHAKDFLVAHPEHEAAVQALCSFLAGVESVDHEHGVPEVGSRPLDGLKGDG